MESYLSDNQEIYVPEKKRLASFGLPHRWRWPLLWTIFFAIVGVVIQVVNKEIIWPNIQDFFWTNFIDFFRMFGSVTDVVAYPDEMSVLRAIAGKWYYFCYTGGLVALLWTILSSIIYFELDITKNVKKNYGPSKEELAKMKEAEEKAQADLDTKKKLEMLIMKGENFLNLGNKKDAAKTYQEIKLIYSPAMDEDKKYFRKILEIYNRIAV
jgi:hypothetical protein